LSRYPTLNFPVAEPECAAGFCPLRESGMASVRRVAVLGYGLAGRFFHAPFIHATPGLELAAVVTGDDERRAQALGDYRKVAVFDKSEEVWTRAEELDLVVVATPNRVHVPLALAALEVGLPVVVDKPLATTADEGRKLVETARQRRLMLTVFQNRRWDGDFLTVKRLLADDALGRVHRFESRFERWRPELAGTWYERADEAGGLLFDLGSHLVDQALQLFGPVENIYAEVDLRRPGAEVDDDVFLALEHSSGVRSHLWMSALAGQLGPRFRVLGDRAAFVKHGLDAQEEALRAGRKPNEPGWGEEPPESWGRLGVEGDLREVQTEPGNYRAFYEGVAASLSGAPPPVDPADAVMVLELLEGARAASRSLSA
jgi:predicted dehydrogenase